jgi:sigma-B regulation protein RsbU (phosphoserine phosphatase)
MSDQSADVQAGRERIELLYRLTSSFNSTLDLEEVLNRVIDEIITVVHAERGFVMLQEPNGEFSFRVARGIDKRTMRDPQANVSLSVVRRVIFEGNPILTKDAQKDERFSAHRSIIALGLRSILCVPLMIKANILGVVYVDNPLQTGLFTRDDLDLLSAIASNAAIAIENARLYQVAVDKGRMERDLQIAHQIQASLLPKEIPKPQGWRFSARWQPAEQVAGDYYDFIMLDEDHIGLIVADVADKGVAASLFMAISRNILRSCAREYQDPCDVISAANRQVCAESTSGYFITMFFARLTLSSGELCYVNAGHPPSFIHHGPEEQALEPLTLTGIPLGIDDTIRYEQRSVTLNPDSWLVCYTDGITEAMDPRQEQYSIPRLEQVITAYLASAAEDGALSTESLLNTILRSVDAWAGRTAQHDDITLLLAHRLAV